MEFYQIKSFVKVAQIGNLRKAAELLNISQSALSSQIRYLESHLDVRLFGRTPKGMELTDPGRVLYAQAMEILASEARFLAKARELSGRACDRIKIGINTDGAFLKIGQLSRMLNDRFPGVNFFFVSSQTIRTPEMLRQQLIDVGFFFGDNRDGDIFAETISHLDLAVVVPERFRPEEGVLTWQALAELPWIWSTCDCPFHLAIQERMDAKGLIPNRFIDAMDESVVKELVMDGQGVGILREDEARQLVSQGSSFIWDQERFHISLCLGILEENRFNPLFEQIIQLAEELWEPEPGQNAVRR